MPFTNILVGLVLIALTVILRVSLYTLRRTARLHVPRPALRPIHADPDAYELLYTMVFDALFSICRAADWAFLAVALLFTFFLCCELLRTAIFIVYMCDRIALRMVRGYVDILAYLLETLAYLLRQQLQVA
jgi:hypothetical protein